MARPADLLQLAGFDMLVRRADVNQTGDKNIGSASGTPAPSASQVLSTLVPIVLVALVWFTIFLCLRPKYSWNYSPRSRSRLLRSSDYTDSLPQTTIGWVSTFFAIPDHVVLQRQSLDAFFFLRFLKMAVVICLVGCAITWPILVPVYATGGGGLSQLDFITVGNVAPEQNFRYFALAGCAWVYVLFILYLITRESIFYINLRQAYLTNPVYAAKLPSRTVLYCAVPYSYLDEAKLRAILGPAVRHIWFPCESKKLDKLVEERDKAAMTLEAAETKLIITANEQRLKSGQTNGAAEDVEAAEADNSASRWLTPKQRPTHRLKPLVGKKVDSIEHSRSELERLTPLIEEQQAKLRVGDGKKYPAVFVEFDSLREAQAAYQSLTHHQPLKMDPRFTGMHPLEVIWGNLKIRGNQRFVRQTVVITIVTLTVVFWSFPVAFVGFISNLSYWTGPHSPTPWLRWLSKMPPKIFGIISGLLPSVALSVLMSLLPPFLKLMAKLGGSPTLSDVEYTVSNYYFAFQVVQVFLVTTLSGAASKAGAQIAQNPSSVFSLLSTSIPSSSNFYLSYIIVQGLGVVAGLMANVAGLVVTPLLAKFLGSTPRKLFQRWNGLTTISYGTVFPKYTNLLVIAIVYSVVAPLVTLFSAIGLYFFYLAYRYNILFVYNTGPDTKGLLFPRALQQLFVGLYIGEVCLIGLLGTSLGKHFQGAIGPFILLILLLVVTVLYNVAFTAAISPLLKFLPKDLDVLAKGSNLTKEPYTASPTTDKAGLAEVEEGSSPIQEEPKHPKPNMFTKFFKPHIYADYATMRRLMPGQIQEERNIDDVLVRDAYLPPSVWAEVPCLIVPRDPAGISGPEVLESGKVVPITDAGATLDEKNKIILDDEKMGELYFQEKSQRMRYEAA